MQPQTIVIEQRFRGPPHSGNGGYVCGAFGGLLTDGNHALASNRAAEVTLRAPVPLDTPLEVRRDDARLTIHDGDTLIAECCLVELTMEVPPAPSYQEAERVRSESPALARNASRWLGSRGLPSCVLLLRCRA